VSRSLSKGGTKTALLYHHKLHFLSLDQLHFESLAGKDGQYAGATCLLQWIRVQKDETKTKKKELESLNSRKGLELSESESESSSNNKDEMNLLPSNGNNTISVEQSDESSNSDGDTSSSDDGVETNVLPSNRKKHAAWNRATTRATAMKALTMIVLTTVA
jgi:hypothetical protein